MNILLWHCGRCLVICLYFALRSTSSCCSESGELTQQGCALAAAASRRRTVIWTPQTHWGTEFARQAFSVVHLIKYIKVF